jgi:hypothetical protein
LDLDLDQNHRLLILIPNMIILAGAQRNREISAPRDGLSGSPGSISTLQLGARHKDVARTSLLSFNRRGAGGGSIQEISNQENG